MVSLDLVLIALYLIPAVAMAVHGSEVVSRFLAGALLLVGAWLALRHNHTFISSNSGTILLQTLAMVAVALCVVIAIRERTKVLGTAMILGSSLQVLILLRVVSA